LNHIDAGYRYKVLSVVEREGNTVLACVGQYDSNKKLIFTHRFFFKDKEDAESFFDKVTKKFEFWER
jgi:hypothetical protein